MIAKLTWSHIHNTHTIKIDLIFDVFYFSSFSHNNRNNSTSWNNYFVSMRICKWGQLMCMAWTYFRHSFLHIIIYCICLCVLFLKSKTGICSQHSGLKCFESNHIPYKLISFMYMFDIAKNPISIQITI